MLSPLAIAVQRAPTANALVNGEHSLSYHQLYAHVLDIRQQLSTRGLTKGDVLACIDHNSIELVLLYWACIELGVVFFPVSPRFPDAQIAQLFSAQSIQYCWQPAPSSHDFGTQHQTLCLDFSRLQLSLGNAANDSITAAHANWCDYSAPSNIILTSGSSGTPKAAVHCLNNHIASAEGARSLIPVNINDAWLLSLPLFHIGGLAILHRCVLANATLVLADKAVPLATQIVKEQITHVSFVAAQLQALLTEQPTALLGIKAMLLGGGAIGHALLAQVKSLNIAAFTSYGMTEMSSQITTGSAFDEDSGQLLPQRQMAIRDGVIWVKGPCLFLGYRAADGTINPMRDVDGWFCTQDRGQWDNDKHLHILGRMDNMFICGGENIQPEEIEAALKHHPNILEAIVFAEPDPKFGFLPSAIIKVSPHLPLPEETELTSFLADKIARFKRPRHYYPWPEQWTQSGLKISRKQIIAEIACQITQ